MDIGQDDDEEGQHTADQVSSIATAFADTHLQHMSQLRELILDFIQPLSTPGLQSLLTAASQIITLKLTYTDPEDFPAAGSGASRGEYFTDSLRLVSLLLHPLLASLPPTDSMSMSKWKQPLINERVYPSSAAGPADANAVHLDGLN